MHEPLVFTQERVLFGPDIPAPVNALLQQAVAARDDAELAEELLWRAQRMNPAQLEVYVALYKFYFYRKRLEEAERAARLALEEAARQGGFAADWAVLDRVSADWSRPGGPERVYLYTLKALGFIRLRLPDFRSGEAILWKLAELDPEDQVGGSVLLDLAEGLRENVRDE